MATTTTIWYECTIHTTINSNIKYCVLCGDGNNMKVIKE